MLIRFAVVLGGFAMALSACSRAPESDAVEEPQTSDAGATETEAQWDQAVPEDTIDAFTYANYNDARVTHAALDLTVDFDDKILAGSVVLDVERLNPEADTLVLDANDLTIESIEASIGDGWILVDYTMGPDDPVKGSRLEIAFPAAADKVRITYQTSPEAEGLQWLSPEQTAGGEHPYLFSQFQPLYARTMAPLQDTPAVRMTYDATVRTPPELIAVMSARQDPTGERDGVYEFKMSQPIPSYLIAIAVGDIKRAPISEDIAVYTEEALLDAAADEFADTPRMEDATSALYGPYRWGRYDMLVLPPSFPFGGMENPRISFLTPTLIAGDKSLTNVVAHELAHSWSGNLVTNATWRDAWLNEGFTSYVENRVMEALYGKERAVMERALDKAALERAIDEAERPELTALKMPADIAHPDDAFSQVSYAGGLFFLKFLEDRYGRDTFDAFLRSYFDHFAFQSITTEDFLAYFEDTLWADNPGVVTKEEIDAWVYAPGFPKTIETPQSEAFANVAAQQTAWLGGGDVSGIEPGAWTTHEWLHFINTLPDDLSQEQFAALDARFDLTHTQNAEIANAWFMKTIPAHYEPAMPALENFLLHVGRGKFIYRLYQSLEDHEQGAWARDVYARARPGYHPIAQRRIDEILKQ